MPREPQQQRRTHEVGRQSTRRLTLSQPTDQDGVDRQRDTGRQRLR